MALLSRRKAAQLWRLAVPCLVMFFFASTVFKSLRTARGNNDSIMPWSDAEVARSGWVHPIPTLNGSQLPQPPDDRTRNESEDCLLFNSKDWLDGPRHGNNDEGMEHSLLRRMLLDQPLLLRSADNSETVMEQTICYTQSRFLNATAQFDDASAQVRISAIRLIYFAIHYHQHIHALPEATIAVNSAQCAVQRSVRNIGQYDYECPNARYLVVSLFQQGLGANIHYVAIQALMAGLALDRVVLFVNGAPTNHQHMKKAWLAASCPRKDAQCFFAPLSPCVLTLDQLQSKNVRSLSRKEKSRLFSHGVLPDGYENDKVVWFAGQHTVPNEHFGGRVAQKLRNISLALIENLPTDDLRRSMLLQATDAIVEPDQPRPGTNFFGASSKIRQALQLYSMRPNQRAKLKLDQVVSQIIPVSVDPERTIGLPIRASDKCDRESECLSFQQHLKAANLLWSKVNISEPARPHVFFTSESKDMVREYDLYTGSSSNKSMSMPQQYPFDFLTNTLDNNPDSGRVWHDSEHDADESMLAAVSTLKFQLYSRAVVGNCCSNFHILIHSFLAAGCGASVEPVFQCLQEVDDPLLRVCCWQSQGCIAQRERDIAALVKQTVGEDVLGN